MVNVFSDPCYKVNHNYFYKHVSVLKQDCIFPDIYIISLKPSELKLLGEEKRFLPKHFSQKLNFIPLAVLCIGFLT